MKLTLDDAEIKTAIIAYARTLIHVNPDTEISVDMTAGRGPNGYSATLDITPAVKHKPVYRTAEAADVNLPEVITAQPYTPGERQAVAEVITQQPMPGLRTPVAGVTRSIEDEPKVTGTVVTGDTTTPAEKRALSGSLKAKPSPFSKPKALATMPKAELEKATGQAEPVVISEPDGENAPIDEMMADLEAADQAGNQEDPEQEPETVSEADTPEDVPAEEPEPAPATTPKLGKLFSKPSVVDDVLAESEPTEEEAAAPRPKAGGLRFTKPPADAVETTEVVPGTQRVSTFSKLNRQPAPETVEG